MTDPSTSVITFSSWSGRGGDLASNRGEFRGAGDTPEGMHDDCVDALALAVRRRTRPGTTVWDLADT